VYVLVYEHEFIMSMCQWKLQPHLMSFFALFVQKTAIEHKWISHF